MLERLPNVFHDLTYSLPNTILYTDNKQLAGRPRHRSPPTSDCKHRFLQTSGRHRVCRKTCGISACQGTGTAGCRACRYRHPRLCRAGRTCRRRKENSSTCNRPVLAVVSSPLAVVSALLAVVSSILVVVVSSLLRGVGALVERGPYSDTGTFHCRLCCWDNDNIVPKGRTNRAGHTCRVDIRSCLGI